MSRGLGAVLLSNPANPTGNLIGGNQLNNWVDVARNTGSYLLFDEFYSNYIWDVAASPTGSVSAASAVDDVNNDPVVILEWPH